MFVEHKQSIFNTMRPTEDYLSTTQNDGTPLIPHPSTFIRVGCSWSLGYQWAAAGDLDISGLQLETWISAGCSWSLGYQRAAAGTLESDDWLTCHHTALC